MIAAITRPPTTTSSIVADLSLAAGLPVAIAIRRYDPWAATSCGSFSGVFARDSDAIVVNFRCGGWDCAACAGHRVGSIVAQLAVVAKPRLFLAVLAPDGWETAKKRLQRAGGDHLRLTLTDRILVVADRAFVPKFPLATHRMEHATSGQNPVRGRPPAPLVGAGEFVDRAVLAHLLRALAAETVILYAAWSRSWRPPRAPSRYSLIGRTTRAIGRLTELVLDADRTKRTGADVAAAALETARSRLCAACFAEVSILDLKVAADDSGAGRVWHSACLAAHDARRRHMPACRRCGATAGCAHRPRPVPRPVPLEAL